MGQGALSKPVVQWWLSLNSSTLGRLLFNHGLGLRVHTRTPEADLVASPEGNRRHQGTQGNKGTPTHNTTDKPLHSALISLWQSAVGVACSCNAMWCGISVESRVSNSRNKCGTSAAQVRNKCEASAEHSADRVRNAGGPPADRRRTAGGSAARRPLRPSAPENWPAIMGRAVEG